MLQKSITPIVKIRLLVTSILTVSIIMLPTLTRAHAQSEDEMKVIGQVNNLIDQLNDDNISLRDEAESSLSKLSPDALDYLDIPNDATTDLVERLTRVRKKLEEKAVAQTLTPSTVTLKSGTTIQTALIEIYEQTGNQVALGAVVPEAAQQRISTELKEANFWTALETLRLEGNLEIDPYGGEAGKIILRSAAVEAPVTDATAHVQSKRAPSAVAGMLSVEVQRVSASLALRNPTLNATTLELLTRWEPRVTPISIQLLTDQLEVLDDQGDDVALGTSRDAPVSSVIQAEIPEVNFPLKLPLISRNIKSLKKIQGTLRTVLPGRLETFTFQRLDELETGASQTKSGATVTWHGYEKNEDLFAATVELSFDEQTNAVDSHLGWAYDNVVELVRTGERFEAVATETIMQRGQKIIVQYLFEEDPAGCELIYKTPAAIVKVDLKFELENIPLP